MCPDEVKGEGVLKRPSSTPTAFGAMVLELMRERRIADASELGLERLDLRALRRHFDGEEARRRPRLVANVAAALGVTAEERTRLMVAYMGSER
jgi:hypothetical protein